LKDERIIGNVDLRGSVISRAPVVGVAACLVGIAMSAVLLAQQTPPAPASPRGVSTGAAGSTSPKAAALAALAVVRATFPNDDAAGDLKAHTFLATTVGDMRSNAQAVIDDDGTDPAAAARKINAVLNDLTNTANTAESIASRPRETPLEKQKLQRFATALRAIAADLVTATLPVAPANTAGSFARPNVGASPEKKAAAAALEIARATLSDTTYVGPRLHTFLTTNLRTLERAAQAVSDDDGGTEGATTQKVLALASALEATIKNARDIAGRSDDTPEAKRKSLQLATDLQAVSAQLNGTLRPVPAVTMSASLTVRFASAKASYRVGEDIALELEFRGTGDSDFYFSTESCGRLSPENYAISPGSGFVDPLSGTASVGTGGSCPSSFQALDGRPFILRVSLNDWARFTEPGRYRLIVTSHRLRRHSGQAAPELTAAPLDFTITPALEPSDRQASKPSGLQALKPPSL
jgi:hypothetical protein